ncbi:MAG: CdaR family protein [Flavobacteriaceae bacterium]
MIQKVKKALKKRKVKLFLIFLLCSVLAWFMNKLSESYTSATTFDLEYVAVPTRFLLKRTSKDQVDVKLKAVGFKFLGFNIKKKKIKIDLSQIQKRNSRYFISPNVYRKQIERQLSGSMTLLEIERDTLFFDFYELSSKTVPVITRVQLIFAQNHLLEEALKVEPDIITITGPKNEIDTIENVQTEKLDLSGLTSDFSHKVKLYKAKELKNTSFSFTQVTVQGRVSRFSEKIIAVPIKVINLPEGMQIKTFPDRVSVLCRARLSELSALDSSDFQITVDYSEISENSSEEMLFLKLSMIPEKVFSANLLENQVAYILNRK